MAQFEDDHGQAAKEALDLISNKEMDVLNVQHSDAVTHLISIYSRIDVGEAEALILAQEQSIPILVTDDFRSLPYLKKERLNVEIHLSTYLLALLVLTGEISKEEAGESLTKISESRDWQHAAIFDLAKKYIDEF